VAEPYEWADERLNEITEKWEQLAPGVKRWRLPGIEPVRQIVTGRRNNRVGLLWSYKMGMHIAQESDHEGFLGDRFEVDYRVGAYFGQPEKLKIEVGSKVEITYTPDFLCFIAGHEVRFEFKLLSALRPRRPTRANDEQGWHNWEKAKKLRERLRLVRQAYRDVGLPWILVTDADLPAMGAEEPVGDIIANGGTDIEPDDLSRLINTLANRCDRALPLGAAEDLLKEAAFPRGAILARIPERKLRIDLLHPINSDTTIMLVERGDD
jgi:hypothetical protein